ncbi:translation initiation factor IF-2 [Tepidamorphus sp. 3E244]|uniref:translation initiation factor IF-2 n=1 Tax=Tepidamorphus sp. 3E244 TaxID=3385498 RepID=UPI0038FC96E8
MSSEDNSGDNTASRPARKTLSLKRTVESGTVRQNFSHGRTKAVVVEKKRRRTVGPGGTEAEPLATAPQPAAAPKPVQPAPQAPAPAPKPAADNRSGVVLRTLTEEEKGARAQALADSRVRDAEERQRAAEEEKRRAEEEERLTKERAEAEARQAEEDAARAKQEAERAKAAPAEQAAPADAEQPAAAPRRPAGGDDDAGKRRPSRPPEKPAPVRRDGERRRGRLTISNALNENERKRSLAAIRRRREKNKSQGPSEPGQKILREVRLPETITIQELANRMAERAVDVIKLLMQQGQMLKINDVIDADTAQLIAEEMGHTVKRVSEADVETGLVTEDDPDGAKQPRAPVVTVMGHVDHGKTSLLDALRQADVVAGEAGGITQHIGAYQVKTEGGQTVSFIDTPGHEAFTAMRARGARVTDIVVLVVAADDGVMPQTIEAINHAKAGEVPLIVAINKMDKPGADPTRVRNELLQHEIVVESLGGDTLEVEVSALKKTNLDKLVEAILLQSEVLDLKANPERPGEGVVVEAQLDKGRGPVATVLVQRGTLRVGDVLVAGSEWGKVRAMINEHGENVTEAGPSMPVEVLGLNATPSAGDNFVVVENEGRAREVSDYRQRQKREKQQVRGGMRSSLADMMTQLKDAERQEVPLLVKGDVQGSVEAIAGALDKLGTDEVSARILLSGVGAITESDVTLAAASNAVVIGFNVRANKQARDLAEREGVEIRYYNIIYDLVDDIKAAMSGLLAPELRETMLGNAEILEVFNISKVGKVAGCRVTDGRVERGAGVRLLRDDVVVHEGKLSTLKRFKDEVQRVEVGQECGMAFENYQDMRAGDVIECYQVETIERSL